ncbi:MAG: thioredoxin domain-containing protein [Gemmatimonadota bacterium]|jgi:hypothetical protein
MPNRLEQESSPYLRQHADNPVDWYPWGSEALELAREEDRPILLSIGYSSCHWCHVMERESFEDTRVADLMNQSFVNIKVDREERPDLDQVYMKAVQAMTGGGGWPMTVFLTPEGVPFYGGTYFPPEPRHGMPSFPQVLAAASEAYRTRKDQVTESGARLVEALSRVGDRTAAEAEGTELLDAAYRTLANQYDGVHGGFGGAPKFPQPVTLELLLRHHLRVGEPAALEMMVHTLRRMAAGGLRDHLAGGFHRYSVDARWLVPHFEKMLYDNALLARTFLQAWLVTGADDLREVAEQTLDYLLADMRPGEGGFSSARDADSEGEEGLFYVWTPEQVAAVLGDDEADLFMRVYDVSPAGNFEGRNILHLPHPMEAVARSVGLDAEELKSRMARARSTLLEKRADRPAPFRDDKVLVSWNALAVRAFAEAGAALGRSDYVDVAVEVADFIWSELRSGDRLLHTWIDGEARIGAFLDDHAGLGNSLLSLHGATLDRRWLERVRWLCEEILNRFWDEGAGTVFDTPSDGEALVLRPRDAMDNATPSGPSLAAELLFRAGHLFDEDRYRDAAGRIVDYEAGAMARYPTAYGRMLSALDRSLAAPVEIVVVGGGDDATRELVGAAHGRFLRNGTIAGRRPDDPGDTSPLLADRVLVDGLPAAYVCRGYACRLPATSSGDLVEELDRVTTG